MNLALGLVKWPCVLGLALLAWMLAAELPGVALQILRSPENLVWTLLGIIAYAALWWVWMRKSPTSKVLATLEHEFAHLLACAVTLRPVTRIEARASGEGHVILAGNGNWIVAAAPYVLPIPLFMPVTVLSTPAGQLAWPWIALGFALGFHVHSTWTETHAGQPDLEELGACAWILLPACHVIVAAWMCGVMAGNHAHFQRAMHKSQHVVIRAYHSVSSGSDTREVRTGLRPRREKTR